MRNSTRDIIEKAIEKKAAGSVIFPSDFKGLASDPAINMALSRLKKDKIIERIAHGIYLVPKHDPLIGLVFPSLEEVAKAIAARDHARIQPAGSFALHKLGLTTQVPMNLVYLTDGAPRKVKVGKGSIRFIKATPKKLLLNGPVSSLVIQALEELGPKEVTETMQQQLKALLNKETNENIAHDFKLTTSWIRQLLIDPSQLKSKHDRVTPTDRRTT
jgi:hypothetical protein